jgi:hypothetical protein
LNTLALEKFIIFGNGIIENYKVRISWKIAKIINILSQMINKLK